MLMKWLDLEPGDKLKFRKEVIDFFEIEYGDWAQYVRGRALEIKNINFESTSLSIMFIDYPVSPCTVHINFDGTPAKYFPGFHSELFEIVELA